MSNDKYILEFRQKWSSGVIWMLERDLRERSENDNSPTIYSDFISDVGYLMLNLKVQSEIKE